MTQVLQENLAKLLQSSDGVFSDRVGYYYHFFVPVVIIGKPILLHIVVILITQIHGRGNKLNFNLLNTSAAVRLPESMRRSHKMRKHS